jgi:hypothetical protein
MAPNSMQRSFLDLCNLNCELHTGFTFHELTQFSASGDISPRHMSWMSIAKDGKRWAADNTLSGRSKVSVPIDLIEF